MTALETFTNSFQATLDHGAPSRHGRYLPTAAGWSRREADIADRGRERQDWAGSYPSLATAQWPKSGPKQT
jgi:hypothetical protein